MDLSNIFSSVAGLFRNLSDEICIWRREECRNTDDDDRAAVYYSNSN